MIHVNQFKLKGIFSLALLTGLCFHPLQAVAKSSLDKARIIQVISKEFNERYVFQETAKKMEAALKKNLADGRYESVDDPEIFAQKLKEDLIDVSKDKHINVFYMEKEPKNPADSPEARAKDLAEMESRNFGFKKLEILTGNVGYIDLREFAPADVAGATAIAAMNYMANTHALIFDLRYNGGGDPSMIQLLCSYLLPENTHLNSFYVRKNDEIQQFWTPAYVQGKSYRDKDVFVLTSGGTFSAAEEFTYDLKNLKRATIVGETSGGGAHPVDFQYFKDIKFAAMIPFGRAINPITKTNWEGTGIEPDIKTGMDQALTVAHAQALQNLLKKSRDAEDKRLISWSIETLKASTNPFPLTADAMKAYAGTYGERIILLENNQLIYTRGTRKAKMIPIAADRFAVEGADYFRLQFNRDSKGNLSSVSGLHQDGKIDKNERSK